MEQSDRGPRILIAEDERPMRIVLGDALDDAGYRVLTVGNGQEALDRALRDKPDLILMDVMMPELDGVETTAELRRLGFASPILMLTAKGQVTDRVAGLDAGADDYLVKPFSRQELLARVRALLRRMNRVEKKIHTMSLGDIQIDFKTRVVTRADGTRPEMTAKELDMLYLLAEQEGSPVSREDFLDRIWGYAAFPTTRTVDNHVASLRAKLEQDPARPRFIKTVYRVGYRLENADINFATS